MIHEYWMVFFLTEVRTQSLSALRGIGRDLETDEQYADIAIYHDYAQASFESLQTLIS
jgi:hypothetical protein